MVGIVRVQRRFDRSARQAPRIENDADPAPSAYRSLSRDIRGEAS
jgi:hypothetical protein